MILWIAATLLSFFVKGVCGFGNTLVFTSMLSFGVDNVAISPVDLLLSCPANTLMVWKYRHEVKWRIWLPAALLTFVGIIPGVLFLKNLDARVVKLIFGIVVILLGVDMLFDKKQIGANFAQSRVFRIILAVISGILCGLYGVSALMVIYFSRMTEDSRAFKANLNMVFLAGNLFRIIVYACTGVFSWAILKTFLILVPFMAGGLFLGIFCAGRLREQIVKKIVIIVLILSGIALILTNLA